MAALVGIDFDTVGGGASPSNWTRIPHVDNFFTINLRDETGVNTPYTLTATTNVGPGDRGVLDSNPVAATTLPTHTQSLAGLDGFAFAETQTDATITITFGNLDVSRLYEVYVFGFDGDGFSDTQQVAIGGAGAATIFTQSPSGNQLWINGELGSSSRSLESYAELVRPNFLQKIIVSARRVSSAAALGGVAIREAGIIVNSTAEIDDMNAGNGVTTLREAIRLVNANPGAETIAFDTTVFATPQTIHLGSQLPTITDTLTITGPGQNLLTLDAGNGADGLFGTGDGYRIFNIDDGTGGLIDVEISGLTLTGGDAANGVPETNGQSGGAIRSLENLTINDSTISGNAAGSGGVGSGGIFGFAGGGGDGGGIYSSGGALTVAGSTIRDNRAGNGGNSVDGGINGIGGSGGGIYSGGGALTISSSTIKGNRTGSHGVGGSGGSGGNGGGIWRSAGVATIDRSTIVDNISRNNGGGIFSDSDSKTTITSSTIAGNRAAMSGGGIYGHGAANVPTVINIDSSTLSGNSAQNGGAAFVALSTTLAVNYSTITGNQAASGGGVATYDNPVLGNPRTLRIQNSIVAKNADLDIRESAHATIISLGHNLVGTSNSSVFQSDPTTLFGVDPLLGPLADHGGPTKTHALLPGSPAIDAVGLLDDYSSNNFATSYNFVDIFSAADNNPQVSAGQANLNVGTGTGAFIWNQGEALGAQGDAVSVDFGFNYPILTSGFATSTAGLALFDTVTGNNLLAEIRVETDKTDGQTTHRLLYGGNTTPLSGAPTGTLNLRLEVTGKSATTTTIQLTLTGGSIAPVTNSLTLNGTELYFGPVAFDVAGAETFHDNLTFSTTGTPSTDQRGLPRPMNGGNGLRPDIDAYESQGVPSYPTGDYNHDGIADAADYVVWRKVNGSAAGYDLWRANFGNTTVPTTPVGNQGASLSQSASLSNDTTNLAETVESYVISVSGSTTELMASAAAAAASNQTAISVVDGVAPLLTAPASSSTANRHSILAAETPPLPQSSAPLLLALDRALAEFDYDPGQVIRNPDIAEPPVEQGELSQIAESLAVTIID